MSDAHIFQLLGLVYAAAGVRGLIYKEAYRDIMKDSIESPALYYLFGLLALVLGFLLVVYHNEWSLSWSVIITIFGWIAFVEGILIVTYPAPFLKMSKWMMKKEKFLHLYAVVPLLLGIFFLLLGFWAV
ncbi:MAG: hypothetical protein JW984_04900 [Deltaproteobacteria bacterium]|uniref:DUF2065 domain-containing protein n=1 Tax=Candidatus Zymogenus saltonus TaxID=2844893 RepID=A0A9D8KEE9_9DELT|nr:hypothetical protein [Candidatus Zymogenus saltonus]